MGISRRKYIAFVEKLVTDTRSNLISFLNNFIVMNHNGNYYIFLFTNLTSVFFLRYEVFPALLNFPDTEICVLNSLYKAVCIGLSLVKYLLAVLNSRYYAWIMFCMFRGFFVNCKQLVILVCITDPLLEN